MGCRRVLLLGLVVACGVVLLRVKTANGTIVLENVPADAVVEIDGDKITVTPTVGEPVKIEVSAGTHGVVVKRGKDVLLGESVTVESGKYFKLTARIEPPVVERSEKTEPPTIKQPSARFESPVAERPERIESPATNLSARDSVPFIVDRARFSVVAGQWTLDGEELIQTDVTRWDNALFFGDDQWTDYDFSVDAMRVGGADSFSVFFRSLDEANGFQYVISGSNKTCQIYDHQHGDARRLSLFDFTLQDHKWYAPRVKVRGERVECFITNLRPAEKRSRFSVSTAAVTREDGSDWEPSCRRFGSKTSR